MAFGKRNANLAQAFATPAPADAAGEWRASETARYEKELKAQTALINTRLPAGCEVAPWAQIPTSVWTGANGPFLMDDCCFYPCHPLNNLLLPVDSHTAATLGLPVRPQFETAEMREECDLLLRELRAGGPDETQRLYKVVALALYLGRMALGDASYDRHTLLFGIGLGMETGV